MSSLLSNEACSSAFAGVVTSITFHRGNAVLDPNSLPTEPPAGLTPGLPITVNVGDLIGVQYLNGLVIFRRAAGDTWSRELEYVGGSIAEVADDGTPLGSVATLRVVPESRMIEVIPSTGDPFAV